CTRIQTNFDSW
nr:immunoglobulin heavy chain junction region [Macaca mulatta]